MKPVRRSRPSAPQTAKFYVNDYFSIADVTLQAIRDEELQHCDAYEARFAGEIKGKKVQKEPTKKKKGVIDLFCL